MSFIFSITVPLQHIISEQFFNDGLLKKSGHKVEHTADVLRLLFVYIYGGFYLDLEYVVLHDLSHYRNMLVQLE